MKKRRIFISAMAILLAVLMAVSLLAGVLGGAAYAVSQAQIDALKAQKAGISEEKASIQAKIDDLEGQKASMLEIKAALDERNELNRQEIDLLNEQIALYDTMIKDKAEEAAEAQADADEQFAKYKRRLRAMEENGELEYLGILFNATTFAELLTKIDMITEIMEYDTNLEKKYLQAKAVAEEAKKDYEDTLKDLSAKKEEIKEEIAKLEKQIEEAAQKIADLEDDIDEFTEAYNENEAAEQSLQSQIDTLVAELKRQEEEARKKAEQQNQAYAGINSSGTFMWPCPSSTYISSVFGYRIHPIFGTERFHSGIDVSANSGAQILASDSGVVAIATYSSSYGNYVMINHGNGNITLYAHMSSMAVSAGQSVSKGQVIGYVGSTGWSTGPHLHFEIRINNTLVNPLNYFSNYTLAPGA